VELKVLAPASVRVVAANALVLIKPLSGGAGVEVAPVIASLKDLARPEVKRIAIGKPTSVPAGRYSQQALVSAQLWDALQTKIVPADNVRQVLDYVARGEVDAGLVYATDAAQLKDKVQVVSRLEGHAPIRYPAAQVSESRQAASAKEFIQFLTEAAAQEVLRSRGFLAP
jgi:molybdate transport system substrate-binding protein